MSNTASFPAPIHEGSTSIWHLADVLAWLAARGDYPVDASVLDIARVAMDVNLARET